MGRTGKEAFRSERFKVVPPDVASEVTALTTKKMQK